jgi:glycosyltransferase involved in cell wall biosynthesis
MVDITILMPIRNAVKTLDETLCSIKAQSVTDFELLIIDDGSVDNSMSKVHEVWGKDPRLRCLLNSGKGLVDALNMGLHESRTQYVARMDADDVMLPQRLAKQFDRLTRDPQCDIVGCAVESFHSQGIQKGYLEYDRWCNSLLTHEDMVRELYVESPMPHPSVMMRRQSIIDIGGYRDMDWPEDYDLWLRAVRSGLRLGKVPEVLLRWRDHENRTSRIHPSYTKRQFMRCKVHHLVRGPLKETKDIVIWGGSRDGGLLGKWLQEEGVNIQAFIDIDPDKIGGMRRGAPVMAMCDLPMLRDYTLLLAVRNRGARDVMRKHVSDLGWQEQNDYLCVA